MARGQASQPATRSPEPTAEEFAAAAASEQVIADEATVIRGDDVELTPALFLKLYPLLRRPIPAAYIQTIGSTEGKPYESTGIRSVQVQIDRMNNVLTPLWWWDEKSYSDDGKLVEVTVYAGRRPQPQEPATILASGSSFGGVRTGAGAGNIYKGSYTNAAKIAFARLGPGHEVYLGAADLDPDVNQEVADQAPSGNGTKSAESQAKIGLDIGRQIVERAGEIPAAITNLRLSVSHVIGRDIGELEDPGEAAAKLAEELTFQQAERVQRWIEGKAREAELTVDPADLPGGDSGE